jgi:DNA-binding PadR family transcriptional regulator
MTDPIDVLPLAPRDLLVLVVLAEGPLHGYGIVKAVEERSETGVLLDPANLYRVLRRMRDQGWVDECEDDGSDRRRTHEITPRGRAVLRAEVERLDRLVKHARPALG